HVSARRFHLEASPVASSGHPTSPMYPRTSCLDSHDVNACSSSRVRRVMASTPAVAAALPALGTAGSEGAGDELHAIRPASRGTARRAVARTIPFYPLRPGDIERRDVEVRFTSVSSAPQRISLKQENDRGR